MSRREVGQSGPTGAGKHYCPVPDCENERRFDHIMCPRCWLRVPRHLRLAIWHLNDRAPGGAEHMRACAAAIKAVQFKLNT